MPVSLDDFLNNFEETINFHKKIVNKHYIIPIDLASQENIDEFI